MATPRPHRLQHEVTKRQLWKERLQDVYPELDDEALGDTLEGLTDLREMLAEIIRSALADEAMAQGLKGRIEDMKTRLARLAATAERKRQIASDCMAEADIQKLLQPDFTASLRPGGGSVIVSDIKQVPEAYWVPQAPKLDRQLLSAHLRGGQQVPGACLSNPKMTLAVRTK